MRECPFCHNPCVEPVDQKHDACHAEFDRRRYGGLCVKCGDAMPEGVEAYYHDSCLGTGDEGFIGYPGE